MKHLLHSTLFLTLSLIFLTGAANQSKEIPQRIVSLVPSVTEELYQLGVQDKIAGVTIYCTHPEDAKKKEKVGTFLQPNVEKILRLKPDIVFTTKEGHSQELVEKLEAIGLRVFVFEPARNYKDIAGQFLQLSKTIGKQKQAERILLSVDKKIASVKRKNAGTQKPLIFWQVGSSPIITSGKNTFADELITLAGGENLAAESAVRYPHYNREEVIRRNPDIIIIIEMGIETVKEIEAWKKYSEMKAVKNRKIFILDGHGVLSPTPLSYVEALEKLSKLIHCR